MEYYDEVVEIEDRPGNIRPIVESGVIGKAIQDDMELNKPTVNIKYFENVDGQIFI